MAAPVPMWTSKPNRVAKQSHLGICDSFSAKGRPVGPQPCLSANLPALFLAKMGLIGADGVVSKRPGLGAKA